MRLGYRSMDVMFRVKSNLLLIQRDPSSIRVSTRLKFISFVQVIVICEFFYIRSVVSVVLVYRITSIMIMFQPAGMEKGLKLDLSHTTYSHIPLVKTQLFDHM